VVSLELVQKVLEFALLLLSLFFHFLVDFGINFFLFLSIQSKVHLFEVFLGKIQSIGGILWLLGLSLLISLGIFLFALLLSRLFFVFLGDLGISLFLILGIQSKVHLLEVFLGQIHHSGLGKLGDAEVFG
jgi:hypothetical protein